MEQQVGLGSAARIRSIEIYWPTSGSRQVFTDVRPKQFIQIKEFEKSFTTQKRRAFCPGAPPHVPARKPLAASAAQR